MHRSALFPAAFYLLLAAPLLSQAVDNITADFTLVTRSGSSVETVRGSLFHLAAQKTILRVTDPVLQWSVFEGRTLLIYYPQERRAFRFISRNRLLLPFSTSFVGLVKMDFGLSDAGFRLEETEVREGVFESTWSPPSAVRSVIGKAVVGVREDRPFYMELYDPDGAVATRIEYSAYVDRGLLRLPTKAKTIQHGDGETVEEEYTYTHLRINADLPEDVVGFRLPDAIEVEEIYW